MPESDGTHATMNRYSGGHVFMDKACSQADLVESGFLLISNSVTLIKSLNLSKPTKCGAIKPSLQRNSLPEVKVPSLAGELDPTSCGPTQQKKKEK